MADADVDPTAHPDPEVPAVGNDHEKPTGKPTSAAGSRISRLPPELRYAIAKSDEILIRLSKLIKTTGGLGAGLQTLQYSLFLAGYLQSKAPSRASLLAYISQFLGGRVPQRVEKAALKAASLPPSPSFLVPLAAMISDTRTTLRLTGLIPLTLLLKSLLSKKITPETDKVAHGLALIQCAGFIVFQISENIFHLTVKGVIPASKLESTGGVPAWVMYSCRGWLVALLSTAVRLLKEAAEEPKAARTAEEKAKADEAWKADLINTVAWLPVAVQYSIPGGIKGWNQGFMGVFGGIAGLGATRKAWAATRA